MATVETVAYPVRDKVADCIGVVIVCTIQTCLCDKLESKCRPGVVRVGCRIRKGYVADANRPGGPVFVVDVRVQMHTPAKGLVSKIHERDNEVYQTMGPLLIMIIVRLGCERGKRKVNFLYS